MLRKGRTHVFFVEEAGEVNTDRVHAHNIGRHGFVRNPPCARQSWCDPIRLRVRRYDVSVETYPTSVEGSQVVVEVVTQPGRSA